MTPIIVVMLGNTLASCDSFLQIMDGVATGMQSYADKQNGTSSGSNNNSPNSYTSSEYNSGNSNSTTTRKASSKSSFPQEFIYYYASANNQPLKLFGGRRQKQVMSVGTMNINTNTVEELWVNATFGGSYAMNVCYNPTDEGDYWHFKEQILMQTYHVYVKKDFSEVKSHDLVFNRRITENEYKKLSANIEEFIKQAEQERTSSTPRTSSSSSSSSSSSIDKNGKAKCKYCNNGICTRCKGTGYTKTPNLETVQCGGCSGSGKCKICYGRGYYYY